LLAVDWKNGGDTAQLSGTNSRLLSVLSDTMNPPPKGRMPQIFCSDAGAQASVRPVPSNSKLQSADRPGVGSEATS
jgi:hypothetical protein